MTRTLVFVGVFSGLLFAPPCRAEQGDSKQETLIRFRVTPARAPTPALRYRLLPELQEMSPGNPIQGYFRAFMAHQKFFLDESASQRREGLQSMPLKALAVQPEEEELGRLVLAEIDRAARLDQPDWQILPRVKTEGFTLLLPDLQQSRLLARSLQARLRTEVALGHFDDALRTAKSLFAMARHVGEHPTLIGGLVGIAIANNTIDPLKEMLEQPGCPNLYWALTTMPSPLIHTAVGMEGERTLLLTELAALDDQAPMDAEQIKKFSIRWGHIFNQGQSAEPEDRVRGWLDARVKDEELLRVARRQLVESGLPEERVLTFPAAQVLLLDEKRKCLVRFDDLMKTMTLPHWEIEAVTAREPPTKTPSLFADDVLPSLPAARLANGRLAQRIAMLRHVEALRLYAAENRGTLPSKLADVSVPLPDDPFTGQPFPYELRGNTAHLCGTPPPGKDAVLGFNNHFEITLQEE